MNGYKHITGENLGKYGVNRTEGWCEDVAAEEDERMQVGQRLERGAEASRSADGLLLAALHIVDVVEVLVVLGT